MRVTPWLYLVGSRQFGLSSRYDCHIYALRSEQGTLLIDAGSGLGQERVLANLRDEFGPDLGPGAILVTHKHPDHSCGAAGLSRALGWPVVTSSLTAPILEAGDEGACGLSGARGMGGYPEAVRLEPSPVTETFGDGGRLRLSGFDLEAIAIPSHSDDSYAFAFEAGGKRCLIAADIVFYGGVVGLIATADSLISGYRTHFGKLAGRDIDALLPGHGLFTLEAGQVHIDAAAREIAKGFVPRSIGQGDLIF